MWFHHLKRRLAWVWVNTMEKRGRLVSWWSGWAVKVGVGAGVAGAWRKCWSCWG